MVSVSLDPKVILVDMDGVLVDTDRGFLNEWREKYPDEVYYPLDQRTTFYIHEQYGVALHGKVRAITSAPGFFNDLPPIEGGIEGMLALREMGHTVRICTAPLSGTPTCLQEKYDWVGNHLGREFASTMVLCKDKTMIRGDYLIDDRPNIEGMYLPEWEHVIFHAPYNAHIKDKRRIFTWEEARLLFV